MGGLVIKRAYILAQQKADFVSTARRIRAIFFLATPHRGSDLAQLLTKILNITSGPRPFVTDLHRNSLATQSINDEFPHYSQDLQLFSFYETHPTSYAIGKSLIVDKDLATLGYVNERTAYLNANHRDVCKYADQSDPNYRTVRNALASTIDGFRTRSTFARSELDREQRRRLDAYLCMIDAPEDDFLDVDSARMSGSCEWLLQKKTFLDWRDSANTQLYWISAKPAAGKTITSGKVVSHLRDLNRDCAFYFFKYGDRTKSSIQAFLLSVAWQMAFMHPEVLRVVLEVCEEDERLSQADYRTIWRKLFLGGLLKVRFVRPQYWIIDGLDECRASSDIVPLLLKVIESCSIRILLTSRDRFESHRQLGNPPARVLSEGIAEDDTSSDIALYLEANLARLPSVDDEDHRRIAHKILAKSAGCFLWAKLILQELGQVHTSAEIRKVLEDVPSDMNELYARILDSMSTAPYGKVLTKAILTWTVCSARPLTTEELFHALQIDIKDRIDSVVRSVASSCGQLVYIDNHSRVQMIHQTARDYLLQADIHPEFGIDMRLGHKRLAMTCLQYLNGSEMKGSTHRKLRFTSSVRDRCPFVTYASNFLFDHISHVIADDEEILHGLAKFMSSSNVLSWIEYIALSADLTILIQAGKVLRNFLQRRSKELSPLERDIALLASWATDLLRLVTKFGKDLLSSPSSIFHLIPPLCPLESAPRKNFAASARGISVLGLSATTWDDCASTISDPNEQFHALACSEKHFALGTFSGKILVYSAITCQESRRLYHCEPVRLLHFGQTSKFLATAGARIIRTLDLTSGQIVWEFQTPQRCMSLATTEDDGLLLGALENNTLHIWDLGSGNLRDCSTWIEDVEGQQAHTFRRPIAAAFCMDSYLLAVVYRGQDILVWDLERDALYDTYSKMAGENPMLGRRTADPGAIALIFSRAPSTNLLAAAYSDGELILFDTIDGKVKALTVANAHTLACSPDGRTLAGGDGSGKLQIFDFETLELLYCIYSAEYNIRQLQFSGDNLQILSIRGSHCRIWDPVVLVRPDAEEESSDAISISTMPQESKVKDKEDTPMVTSIACFKRGEIFYCGKEDGSVHMYEAKSGRHIKKLAETLGTRSKSKILLWDSSNFSIEAKTAVAVPEYHYLADQVQLFIESNGQRLVFLHSNGWVCSVDPQSTSLEHFVRHFFFPADWLSTDSPLLIEITRRSDILFVKGDEIAVIKRGLETSDRDSGGTLGKSSLLNDVRRPLLQLPDPH
ncbi:MAG: hypothetical protein LQ343_002245 [Gyalolechia ehrenbergii]|nr:MAG: hypothetical protein LQ343_002245 [Gyalolechia ehrenbergii]